MGCPGPGLLSEGVWPSLSNSPTRSFPPACQTCHVCGQGFCPFKNVELSSCYLSILYVFHTRVLLHALFLLVSAFCFDFFFIMAFEDQTFSILLSPKLSNIVLIICVFLCPVEEIFT